ncbi:MAG: fumarylacetoacetate hydrolase family protein [Sphingomonas sp.]|uniref:2-keto-4-pentenoate hydratase n=1 Tax=Sphingomonas sp. TaxID=28214 RepID=UPI0025E550AE|nr:fumarylacetoacetate hydrolase family protein [Sphingomonas sp.]MBX3563570.1 fumarylacetoacetate hydrolase family protein [Sphingomonas sp.]
MAIDTLTPPARDLERFSLAIREAYASGVPIAPIRDALPDASIEQAYAIQEANTAFWQQAGRVPVGAKIGLTAKTVQVQLGVDQPDFGTLFADMSVPDGETIAHGRLLQPKVEAEIAFVLGRRPDPARLTTAELLSCIDYALPALEIVDSRIANWDIRIVDTVADNASSGLFVLGTTPVPVAEIDLRLCGMVLEQNGDPVSFGAGAACLGNPLHALGWLAAKMAEVGRPLDKGDIVLAGALGPMVAAQPGDSFEARIEGLGAVRVAFAAA